ncbi:hypothetical protein ACLOJK_016609 [Asimina triloba]
MGGEKKEISQNLGEDAALVSNGSVDYHGKIADKKTTGRWLAAPFIIVNEVAERLAFYAIAVNMVSYLVLEMHESLPAAATHVTDWIGAAFVLTLLGAFLADAYLGRFRTIMIFSCIYVVGMILLTLSGSLDSLRPPPCLNPVDLKTCPPATTGQSALLYIALGLIALGTGGIKPCVSSFGADQFDEADKEEASQKYAFFNWFFFGINMGVLIGITFLVYVQVTHGWGWGFGAPAGVMFLSVLILVAGLRLYRYQKPMGSAFTRFVQVMVAAVRNHLNGVEGGDGTQLYEVETTESDIVGARKLPHTRQYRFLDKAAVATNPSNNTTSRWRLCTVTQVEEFKCFIRILPVWASTIALAIPFAQLSTFFMSQARIMDRKLPNTNFIIPPGSIPIFAAINGLILVPIYEGLIVPILRRYTGHHRGITSLQRMGVGLFISIFATISAAVVEKKRLDSSDQPSMSVFWLIPQFFLVGSAEVFTYVGQLEFFYDEATEGTKSLSSAIFLSEIGLGSWLSTALVKIVEAATGGEQKGWLRNNLNESRLDYFYWILTAVSTVNFFIYLPIALFYKGKNRTTTVSDVRGYLQPNGTEASFSQLKLEKV